MEFKDLPDNRFDAIEEIRILLGFGKAEWKCLLKAISKTDNGWLQYMFGDVSVDLKKIVDIDELELKLEVKMGKKATKSATYNFDLNELTRTHDPCFSLESCE